MQIVRRIVRRFARRIGHVLIRDICAASSNVRERFRIHLRLRLWGRLHVRFCIRNGVRFAAHGVSQVNFQFVFAEMCRQTVDMGVG
jgi:hypothetical protein